MNVPQHIAIILDGNGRWAKSKGMPRNYGHAQGSKNVERICEEAWRMGIKYLTVYAFSTENWNRPQDEVDALMKLLRNYMKTCLKTAKKNYMKVRVIGDLAGLDDDIRNRIVELQEATRQNGGLNFQIALNYGSRDEILRAVRRLAADCAKGVQKAEEIFQARIDAQVQGGAFYPETIEGWKKAQVITKGSVVALISAGDSQSSAVEAFEKLFA